MFVGNLCAVCGQSVVDLWAKKNKCNDYRGLVIEICGQFVRRLWAVCDQFVIYAFYAVITMLCCAESLYFGYTQKQRRTINVYGINTQSIHT